MKSGKGIGKTIGKIAAICGAAGALEIFTNCFLFGGSFAKGEKDEDDTEDKDEVTETSENEPEKVSSEDMTIEETTD